MGGLCDSGSLNALSVSSKVSAYYVSIYPHAVFSGMGCCIAHGDGVGNVGAGIIVTIVSSYGIMVPKPVHNTEFSGAQGQSADVKAMFPDVEAVNGALQSEPVNGKTILIKGSNSIGLTKTITNL